MKKSALLLSVFAILLSSLFPGCKKGDGDPFLSLSSRKARLCGKWTVAAGEGSSFDGVNNSTWTYDGTVQKISTAGGPVNDYFTMEYEFKKDGTFTATRSDTLNNVPTVITSSGNWNWLGGAGDVKNKEQIILITTDDGSGSHFFSGDDAPRHIYDIYQLKRKEMIIKLAGTYRDSNTSNNFEETWTLRQ